MSETNDPTIQANAMIAELMAVNQSFVGRIATLAGEKAVLAAQLERATAQIAELSKPKEGTA
ncbi:MAG: hypothetical protein EPO02_13790 [Nitrospirae bacterium]|nr:MAG: hypothetical protein EPO02_13790 [Nitrospirota bacterium]